MVDCSGAGLNIISACVPSTSRIRIVDDFLFFYVTWKIYKKMFNSEVK